MSGLEYLCPRPACPYPRLTSGTLVSRPASHTRAPAPPISVPGVCLCRHPAHSCLYLWRGVGVRRACVAVSAPDVSVLGMPVHPHPRRTCQCLGRWPVSELGCLCQRSARPRLCFMPGMFGLCRCACLRPSAPEPCTRYVPVPMQSVHVCTRPSLSPGAPVPVAIVPVPPVHPYPYLCLRPVCPYPVRSCLR